MSADDTNDNAFQVTLANGQKLTVKCPVCGGEKFGTARPPDFDSGMGFQHVIIGREVAFSKEAQEAKPGRTLSLPVRFKFCLDCGFVLKFMIEQDESEGGKGPNDR